VLLGVRLTARFWRLRVRVPNRNSMAYWPQLAQT
jgi:hypothetical protein